MGCGLFERTYSGSLGKTSFKHYLQKENESSKSAPLKKTSSSLFGAFSDLELLKFMFAPKNVLVMGG